jgi:hypothetical protein
MMLGYDAQGASAAAVEFSRAFHQAGANYVIVPNEGTIKYRLERRTIPAAAAAARAQTSLPGNASDHLADVERGVPLAPAVCRRRSSARLSCCRVLRKDPAHGRRRDHHRRRRKCLRREARRALRPNSCVGDKDARLQRVLGSVNDLVDRASRQGRHPDELKRRWRFFWHPNAQLIVRDFAE